MLRKGESSSTLCNEFGNAATLQHCKEHFKGSCLLQLVSQWHEENVPKQDLPQQPFSLSWVFCTCNLFSGLFCLVVYYNWLQKYLRHCTVFWLKWPVHDLVLVIPPPPLIKVASNTRPCSKHGGQYYTVSHRSVNNSDLKQERSFFPRTISIFCIWLKFLVEKSVIKSRRHGRRTRIPNEKKCQSTMWVLYLLSS